MERKYNPQHKLHIRKGDTVRVIAGNDKGKDGEVLEILTDKYRAIVKDINIVTKHQKPSAGKPEGGINKTEAAITVNGNHNGNRHALFNAVGLGIERLAKFHDVQTTLTQCRTNGW